MEPYQDIPLGFAMALAQDAAAAQIFYKMPQSRRLQILERARQANSKAQMQAIVWELTH